MSNRIEKVNSLLEKEISSIILRDFDFSGAMVTVTHVEATPNLIDARTYVSVMPEEKLEHVIGVLNKGVHSIQQKVNKKLFMRPIPKIRFVGDKNTKEAARIEELLEKIRKPDTKN